jgi:DNA polymerase delta subunit 2
VLVGERLVTGVVLAVRGRLDSSSSFAVEAVCVAGFAPQPPLPPSVALGEGEAAAREGDQYLALVSGLDVGPEGDGAHALALQLLLDYLSAHVGGGGAELSLQGRIVRLVVCGGLLSEAEVGKPVVAEASKAKNARANRSLAAALHALEAMLLPVAASLPIDLMAGAGDPSNVNLPQQPLHHCLLPLLARHAHFAAVTNPHAFELAGLRVVGTSGQPVTDALKYRREAADGAAAEAAAGPLSSEQALEDMLRWRHLAPTAPDTLPCFPYAMSDPFVLAETPHVAFAGNQPRYGTRLLRLADGARVRLVSVPSFAATRTAVLVNLRTLRCHPISFRGYDAAAPTE